MARATGLHRAIGGGFEVRVQGAEQFGIPAFRDAPMPAMH
jgi:hypothetical protein